MSDLLASAATALGLPEALVQRSAEARATATGSSIDDVLAAWASGGSLSAAPVEVPDSDPAPKAADDGTSPAEEAPPASNSIAGLPSAPPPAPVPAPAGVSVGKPPVLVGATDNPMITFIGAVGLFLVILLVGLVGPGTPDDPPGARSSEIDHTAAGVAGQALYESLGCAACHTQMVRPVVADVGLGAVSLNDSNQVLGTRRFGPDLADVGSRLSASQMEAIVTGFGGHPTLTLSGQNLGDLVAYLTESSTAGGAG